MTARKSFSKGFVPGRRVSRKGVILQDAGKYLIAAGVFLIIVGALLSVSGKVPFIGRLPGDLVIRREGLTFYFPVTTCVLASLLLSAVFYFFSRR